MKVLLKKLPFAWLIAIGIAFFLVIVLGIIFTTQITKNTSEKSDSNSQIPAYQTVLPIGKSIDQLGGWSRVSPPDSDAVHAFSDTIENISVTVSQQQLPQAFQVDTDAKVAELAKNYNATNILEESGSKIYIGNSAKGPQSVILTKKSLLILIKSQQKISDAAWIAYVASLR